MRSAFGGSYCSLMWYTATGRASSGRRAPVGDVVHVDNVDARWIDGGHLAAHDMPDDLSDRCHESLAWPDDPGRIDHDDRSSGEDKAVGDLLREALAPHVVVDGLRPCPLSGVQSCPHLRASN